MIGTVMDGTPMRFTASVRGDRITVTTTDDQTYFMNLMEAKAFGKQLDGAIKALDDRQ